MSKYILLLILFTRVVFGALLASDIDPQPATNDIMVIFMVILSVLVLLFSYKKILIMLGR